MSISLPRVRWMDVAIVAAIATLMSCGFQPSNPSAQNALYLACLQGKVAAARASVREGADVNDVDAFGGTPLQAASRSGSAEVVRFLIEEGAGVDDNPGLVVGRTPLQEAVMKGHFETVVALVEGGADVNKPNTNGRTPLDFAALALDDPAIAEYLVTRNARFSREDNNAALERVGLDVRRLREWPARQ